MTDIPPERVREKAVSSDGSLTSSEKELRMVCPNDVDHCTVSTEIPTIMKWLQSIEEASYTRVRTDGDGKIVGLTADIPKGIVKLQSTARKSDQHSQMVSYGPVIE